MWLPTKTFSIRVHSSNHATLIISPTIRKKGIKKSSQHFNTARFLSLAWQTQHLHTRRQPPAAKAKTPAPNYLPQIERMCINQRNANARRIRCNVDVIVGVSLINIMTGSLPRLQLLCASCPPRPQRPQPNFLYPEPQPYLLKSIYIYINIFKSAYLVTRFNHVMMKKKKKVRTNAIVKKSMVKTFWLWGRRKNETSQADRNQILLVMFCNFLLQQPLRQVSNLHLKVTLVLKSCLVKLFKSQIFF